MPSLSSAWRTVFIERKMPYRVERAWHKTAIAAGFPETTIAASGFKFRVRRETCDVDFVRHVVIEREYFPPGIALPSDGTVIDVGGNIGTFAVLAASMVPNGRVLSAEPARDNLALFRRNIALNDSFNVSVLPVAVASRTGMLTFYSASEGGYHTIVAGRVPNAAVTQVPAITLANLFEQHQIARCALLKLDCEGAEYDIVASLVPEVASRIDQIAMEYHRAPDRAAKVTAMRQRLASLGFIEHSHEPFPEGGGHLFLKR